MLQSDSAMKRDPKEVPFVDSNRETNQTLTNLPAINLKLRGFRIVIPSCINSQKLEVGETKNCADLFTIQAGSLLVTSRLENPIPRLVVDKKLSKILTAYARTRRGSAAERGFGDTQYKVEVKSLRVWSGCWEDLCKMLRSPDSTRIEIDLFEQNPALEWNTYSG